MKTLLLLTLLFYAIAFEHKDDIEFTSIRLIGVQKGYDLTKTLVAKLISNDTLVYFDNSVKHRRGEDSSVCVGALSLLVASMIIITGILCVEIRVSRFHLLQEDAKYGKLGNDYDKDYNLWQILRGIHHIPNQNVSTFPSSLHTYFKQRLDDRADDSYLMKYEWARYETYKTFPLTSPARPTRLAAAGFYHIGTNDTVRCFCCNIEINEWKEGDVPVDIHKRYSPLCPLVTGRHTENVAIHVDNGVASNRQTFETDGSPRSIQSDNTSDIADCTHSVEGACSCERTNEDLASVTAEIRDMGFDRKAIEAAFLDLKTQGIRVTIENLVSYFFDGNIEHLDPDRSMAISEHKRNNDNIPEIMSTATTGKENVHAHEETDEGALQEENDRLVQRIACKVCLDTNCNVVFMPCGHVISCDACAAKLKKCAVCRLPIQSRVRTN